MAFELRTAGYSTSNNEVDSRTRRNLEQWTADIVEALDQSDWQSPAFERLAPDFYSDREVIEENRIVPATKKQYLAKHQLWSTLAPQRRIRVLDVVCDLQEPEGTASVWLWLKVEGLRARNIMSESVAIIKWQRRQGIWCCYKHTGTRHFAPLVAARPGF